MELTILVAVYFLPLIIARVRLHNSKHAIAALNILLGWTGVFWLWALIWSLTGNTAPVTNKQPPQGEA